MHHLFWEQITSLVDKKRCVTRLAKLDLDGNILVLDGGFFSVHCKLEQLLKEAELNRKLTPVDLLFKYGKVYHVNLKDHSMITEVTKKVKNLE